MAKLIVDGCLRFQVFPHAVAGDEECEAGIRLCGGIRKHVKQLLDRDEFATQVRLDFKHEVGVGPDQFEERLGVVLEGRRDRRHQPLEVALVQQRPRVGQTLAVAAIVDPVPEQGQEILVVSREPSKAHRGLEVVVALRVFHVPAKQRSVRRDVGDGFGFDRESFRESGVQVCIEVVVPGAFGYAARKTGDAVEPREFRELHSLGFRRVCTIVVGVFRSIGKDDGKFRVEHCLDGLDAGLGFPGIVGPGREKSLGEVLEKGAVVARDTRIGTQAQQCEGRGVRARAFLHPSRGQGAQDVFDSPEVQRVGNVVLASRFPQHRRPGEKREVIAVHVQCPRVPVQGLVRMTGVEKQLRLGLVHVDQAGDIVDQVERLHGGLHGAFLEKDLAKVDEDLRRQFLAQPDQAPAVRELSFGVAGAGREPGEAGLGRCQCDQLPQHRGASHPRFGERILHGAEFRLVIAHLLGDVPEQLVQIELVVVAGDTLQDDPLAPAERPPHRRRQFLGEGARADHVDDAVDGDDELGVVRGMLCHVLQDRHGFVAPARVLHQVRHEQQVVAVLGMQDKRAAVARDGFRIEAAHGVDARFELPADALLVEFSQAGEPVLDLAEAFVGLLREIEGQHVEHDVLDVLDLILGVRRHEFAQHHVVGGIVGEHHVDLAKLAQAFDLARIAVAGVFLDDFGGGEVVADFGVDSHQEPDLVAVRLFEDEFFLQVHDDVAQGVEFGRKQQELAFREVSSGRALNAHPDSAPGLQGVFLASGNAVEPRKPHAFVVAEFAFTVPQALEDADRRLGPAEPFIGVGQVSNTRGAVPQGSFQSLDRSDGLVGFAAP